MDINYKPQIDLKSLLNNKTAKSTPSFIGPVATRTQTLPMDTGSYQTPSGIPTLSDIFKGNVAAKPITSSKPTAVAAPAKAPVVAPKLSTPTASQSAQIPPQWLKPDGTLYTPQEIAANMAASAPGAGRSLNGDVPKFAGDTLTQKPQTTEQLQQSAAGLNNARNDLAVGETDPYKVGSQSGIAYTPQELAAIEKAYAGIYDPAINAALSKLDVKQKENAAALENKGKLELEAQKHKYDVELKKTAPGIAPSTVTTGGAYVAGANPAVDAWAQAIYNGKSSIKDIPASQKGMRDAVQIALQATGNRLDGKPTTSALGIQALQSAKNLLKKFDDRTGTNVVGGSRLFGGGAIGQNIPGTDQYGFANDFRTLKSQLSLDASKYLSGQGQVSDAERALLSSAVSSLDLAQSDGQKGDFRKTLQAIIDKLEGNAADSNIVTAPDGQQVQIVD